MEQNWIKTEQVIENLKNNPDKEQEYTHYIGGILRSTYWMRYDPKTNLFGCTTDWDEYYWYTEEELLEDYAGHWWSLD